MESADRPIWNSGVWPAALGVLVLLLVPLLLAGAEGPSARILPALIVTIAVLVTAWALRRTRVERRAYENRLTAWAEERATQAERLRIARELHDLASHGLGLITVRAAAARGVPDDDERRRALDDIERASREATAELRRMLAVLRSEEADAAPLRPADTLADLPAIIAAAETSGLRVRLDCADSGDVSAGTQLVVCAIVREGLTNIVRHAGPTTARVSVRRTGEHLEVRVDDDGPMAGWVPLPGAGHGLAGLLERTTALGGTLHAGPTEQGYRLVARLPDSEAA